jgi:ssDNA-binding Zn-finger/Zn-ribbon topoisomerase 1
MPYTEVANLIQQGQADEALRVCLKDQSTPFLDAEGYAAELLWIAAAFAKQGKYQDALNASRLASKSHSLDGDTARTVRAFEIALDPAHPQCTEVRGLIKEEFIPKAERDMQKTVTEAKRRTSASSTQSTREKTLFKQEADDYQKSQERTKGQGTKSGLSALGIFVALLIIAVVAYLILGQDSSRAWAWQIGIGVVALLSVITFIQTIAALLRSTKTVTCPKCNVEHQIYKNVEKYVCTNCRSLLLMAKDGQTQPRLLACPYCGLQTSVADDYGRFLCPNCGIIRQSDDQTPPSMTSPCPSCHEPVPENAIYCEACGRILISDFSKPVQAEPLLAYDRDWEIGKDATGHFHYARALLEATRNETEQAVDLDKIQSVLRKLKKALISVEEALQESILRPAVEALVPEIDRTYAHLLRVESSLVALQAIDPRGFEGSSYILTDEPHVTARRRMENILGDSLMTSGGIGRWAGNLVEIQTENEVQRITNFDRLLQERERFDTWEAQLAKQ